MPFWYNKCTGESRWNPPAKRAYEEEMDASHFKQTRRHQSKSGMKRVSKEEERVSTLLLPLLVDMRTPAQTNTNTQTRTFLPAPCSIILSVSFSRACGHLGFLPGARGLRARTKRWWK